SHSGGGCVEDPGLENLATAVAGNVLDDRERRVVGADAALPPRAGSPAALLLDGFLRHRYPCNPHERSRQARCTRRPAIAPSATAVSGTRAGLGVHHARTSPPRPNVQL